MISLSGRKWEQKKINQNLVDKLKQDFNFSDILSRLIISRKFEVDEIATINADLVLNNVFLNNEDFNQSIKLVVDCINNNEKIVQITEIGKQNLYEDAMCLGKVIKFNCVSKEHKIF